MDSITEIVILRESYLAIRSTLAKELARYVMKGALPGVGLGLTLYIQKQYPEYTYQERMDLENFTLTLVAYALEIKEH